MSSEVGSGQVAVYPVFKGFRSAVVKETDGAAKAGAAGIRRVLGKAGALTGAVTGKGFKAAFDDSSRGVGAAVLKKLQTEVAAASKTLSAARLKEQDATGKLRVAEAQLVEVRGKYAAGSARVIAAEEKAASAARSLASAQESTKDASTRLSTAQTRVKDATTVAAAAVDRGGRSFRGAGLALGSMTARATKAAAVLGAGLAVGAAVAGVALLGRGVHALTGYLADSVTTAAQWDALNAQSAAVVKSTGGAAQVTAKHVGNLSQALENQTATEAEAIQKGANLLLTFTGIRNEAGRGNKIFDRTTAVAVDMSRALGIDVSAAALQLGKALNDPAQGLTKLQRSGVTFTDQQKKQVVQLVKTGHTLEAQKLILRELDKEFGGSGAAYAKTYAGALYRIKDAAGDFGASIAQKALPGIGKLLGTGADLINWAAGTNRVKGVADAVASAVGRIADKAGQLSSALKGKNPLQDAFKIVLPSIDPAKLVSGVQAAIGVAQPILSTFLTYVRNIGPAIGQTLSVLGPALGQAFVQLGPALQQVLPQLGQAVVQLLPSLVTVLLALTPLIPPIAQIITNLAPVIKIVADVLSVLITNGLVPAVQATADLGRGATALASGLNPLQVAVLASAGAFGPVLQAASRFGFALGSGARAVGLFVVSTVGGFVRFAGGVASAIGRGIAFVQRLGAIPGIGARAVGGFVVAIAGGFGRAVGAASAGVGRVLSTVRSLPGRIGGVLGNLGGILVASGRSLIEGFARGIRDAIGAAVAAAKGAVSAVARFFPHSPAQEGPFSGRGWTLYSGRATGLDYAKGLVQTTPSIRAASNGAMQAAVLARKAAVASTSTSRSQSTAPSSTSNRPVYMDGSLFGMLREMANGEAQIVLNTQTSQLNASTRLGRQAPTFV